MARPLKDGLDYFNHDVEMSNDIKIKKLESKFGLMGYAIYNKILEQVYKYNGDFSLIAKEDLMLYSKDWNIEIKQLKKIISYSIEIKLFENQNLSSNSIRKRLQKIQDDRKYKREYAERKKEENEKNKKLGGVIENKTTSNRGVLEDKEKNSIEKNRIALTTEEQGEYFRSIFAEIPKDKQRGEGVCYNYFSDAVQYQDQWETFKNTFHSYKSSLSDLNYFPISSNYFRDWIKYIPSQPKQKEGVIYLDKD